MEHLPDACDHPLIVSRRLFDQPIHAVLLDSVIHRRQVLADKGEPGLIIVPERSVLRFAVIRGSLVHFGLFLVVDPGHTRLFEVILQLSLLTALDDWLVPFSVFESRLHHFADAALLPDKFDPHTQNIISRSSQAAWSALPK